VGAEQHRTLGAGRVEDGPEVVHASLQRRRLARPIGEPGAAAVEDDDPREHRGLLEEAAHERGLELDFDVPGKAVREQDIARTLADDRARDRYVAVSRVPDAIHVRHTKSLDLTTRQRKRRPHRHRLLPQVSPEYAFVEGELLTAQESVADQVLSRTSRRLQHDVTGSPA
jgi:hypothetical protein